MVRRKTVDRLNAIRDSMIAGVWGNSNYDAQEEGKEGPRREILARIDEQFQETIEEVYTGKKVKKADDIDWTDPFFKAIKSPRINSEAAITGEPGSMPESKPDDPERRKAMEALDQL